MKEAQLREHADCDICHKPIGNSGVPMFWVLKINRYGLNLAALQRQQGLGMMLGAQLAMVMGANEDLATPMMEPVTITVCETCCTTSTCVAALAEDKS